MKMAGNMFLHLSGNINGESLDEAQEDGGLGTSHKNSIEVKTWEWVTTNKVKWDVNQGGQSTHADVGPIKIQKTVDSTSHRLYKACTNGEHIETATLYARKNAGEGKMTYLKLELKDVMVNSMNWSGQAEDSYVNETVELSFAEFKINYSTQNDQGLAQAPSEHGWNVQKQKAA
jgi:type VI secretion system secreted protein Hcp